MTTTAPKQPMVSLETQMTHFPALAPEVEENSRDHVVIKKNGNTGIINSIFGSIFRSNPAIDGQTITENGEADKPSEDASVDQLHDDEHIDLQNPSTSHQGIWNTREYDVNGLRENNHTNSTQNIDEQQILSADNEESTDKDGDVERRLKNYKQSEFRRYWMPDATGRECYECHEKFNAFRRRHHCRLCGQIFCGRCSNRQINGAELGYSGVLRLCNYCANQVENHMRERHKKSFAEHMMPSSNSNFQRISSKEKQEIDLSTPFLENILRRAEGEFADNDLLLSNTVDMRPSTSSKPSLTQEPSPSVESDLLTNLFEQNLERILDDVLRRENLDPTFACLFRWRNLLLTLSRLVVDAVTDQVLRISNAVDFLNFVHIKKIASSSDPHYEIIHGVAFSKTLAHQSMSIHMENVSLMLLAGTISYERVLEKLSSLEQIMLQEKEYLKTQVERVTSRRVSLLLVENSVSQLASDMLLDTGVGLVTNVKHRVLERIARATNSDIISSLDAQFLQPRIGFAPDFTQRQFTSPDGVKKNVLILNHCFGGLSVLLYGRSTEELIAAKRALKFLLLLRYSSRLEIAFLRMFDSVPGSGYTTTATASTGGCLKRESSQLEIKEFQKCDDNVSSQFDCELCHFNRICEDWDDPDPSEFMKVMRETQLTNSPAIHFAPPFFETSAGRADPILPYFRRPLFHFFTPEDVERLRESDANAHSEMLNILRQCKNAQKDNENLHHLMLDDDMSDPNMLTNTNRWARFRVQSWFMFRRRYELNRLCDLKRDAELNDALARRTESRKEQHTDLLNPYNCQRIPFLYCANTKKVTSSARTFCMGPYVLLRQFFIGQAAGNKDTSLGVFLTNYCFNTDYKCGNCERSMTDHLRRIVHRNARIEISTHCLPKSSASTTSGISAASSAALDDLNLDGLPSSIPNMNCSLIICWRRCPKCGTNSCSIPLPDAVYHLSFAKFIDYLANATYWISAFPTGNFGETCKHCTFHEHVHYFAYHNFIAIFRVYPIRPLHVAFNPMICRINAKDVLCSDLIEANYDLNSTASDAFDSAISFFKDFQQSASDRHFSCQLSSAAESLLAFVEQFKLTFRAHMGKFDPDGIFKRNKMINSNDPYYRQSESCLMRCRYFLHTFISKWNASKMDTIFIVTPYNLTAPPSPDNGHAKPHTKCPGSTPADMFHDGNRTGSATNLLSDYNADEYEDGEMNGQDASSKTSNNSRVSSGALVDLDATPEPPVKPEFSLSANGENNSRQHSRQNSSSNTTTYLSKIMSRNQSRSDVATIDNGSSGGAMATSANLFVSPAAASSPMLNVPTELPQILSTLPKNLHFELPMCDSAIQIRDLIDGKSSTPDIGSIIAYTLSSNEYDEKKQCAGKSDVADNTCWEFSFGSETKSKYTVKVYFAEEFDALRKKLFGDGKAAFIRSLSHSNTWHPQGGKSGANFFRTEDERFVIKQMLRLELESFKKFGPSYFDYVNKAYDEQRLTSLCKIYGVFGINITGKAQTNLKIDVLIMEYLFYNKNVKQVWDLKGSLRNRYASTKTEAPVLLDENLVQDLWGNQLYVHHFSKTALNQAITNDSNFLRDQGIMDYSLLAGVGQDEVVIGIVDYVRTFTLDKKVESLVKNALPMAHTPTVLSPELYCKRFYEAIDNYFAVAPDQWTTTQVPDTTALLQQQPEH